MYQNILITYNIGGAVKINLISSKLQYFYICVNKS